MSDTKDGYDAKSFKGIPIAIEWHSDGSVTLCMEAVEAIRRGDTSLLVKPVSGNIYFMNKIEHQTEDRLLGNNK